MDSSSLNFKVSDLAMDRSAEQYGNELGSPSHTVPTASSVHSSCHLPAAGIVTAESSGAKTTKSAVEMSVTQQGITAEEAKPRCYFLELPPELRLKVYEFVFEPSHISHYDAFEIDPCGEYWEIDCPKIWWNNPHLGPSNRSLLRTSRLIYSEAAAVLYDSVAFIQDVDGPCFFFPPVKLAPFQLAKFVRRVQVQIYFAESSTIIRSIDAWCSLLSLCEHELNMKHIQVHIYTDSDVEEEDRLIDQINQEYSRRQLHQSPDTLTARIWRQFINGK
jgi:hypothetical protein